MTDRPIVKIRDGKIVNTGKTRLPDGTIRVQPEGGMKFIPKTVKKAMGGKVQKMREGGNAMSDADRAMIQALLGESGKTISDADRAKMARMMRMGKGMKMGGKVQKMNMGGEVMDTTKSMPVGMMDGGKVKPMKMNMGGVVPGRGGKFKGVR